MATKPPSSDNSQPPFEAPELSRLYREGRSPEPPPHLDDPIVADAHRAAQSPAPTRRRPTSWAAPVALAAVLVLSVTVVLLMSKEGVEPLRTAPMATPQAKVTAPVVPAPMRPPELATPQRALPEAKQLATRESESAQNETVLKKSAGVPAPATPYRAETTAPSASLAASDQARRAQAAGVVAPPLRADVMAVAVQGRPGAYQLAVTVKSPDTGCAQYADWWEVLSLDGKLLYRRVLDHSHVNEQPFLRPGGPVPIQPDTVVWIRAHMHPAGYGGDALKGSVASGFQKTPLPATFAGDLAQLAPLPATCDF